MKRLMLALFLLATSGVYAQTDADLEAIQELIQEITDLSSQVESSTAAENFDQADTYLNKMNKAIERLILLCKKLNPEMASSYNELLRGLRADEQAQRESVVNARSSLENTNGYTKSSTTELNRQPVNTEILVNSSNVRTTAQPTSVVKNMTISKEEQLRKYESLRLTKGESLRNAWQGYINGEFKRFNQNVTSVCSIPVSLNTTVALTQAFSTEPCQYSIEGKMPWSIPVNLPGTKVQFQYSVLFYCRVTPLALGDQMASVADDYGFVRIINNEHVSVSGLVEFEYIDSKGTTQKSHERFMLKPGEKHEEMGMWYLACKFLNVTLKEFSCK